MILSDILSGDLMSYVAKIVTLCPGTLCPGTFWPDTISDLCSNTSLVLSLIQAFQNARLPVDILSHLFWLPLPSRDRLFLRIDNKARQAQPTATL